MRDDRLERLSDDVRSGIPVGFVDALEVIDYQEGLRMRGYDERWRKWNWRAQFVLDAWLCLTRRASLHRAWQAGYDDHIRDDSARRARGGN